MSTNMLNVKVKKLNDLVRLPERAHFDDAGFDCFSLEDVVINPGERHCFSLGFAIEMPINIVGMIQGKSGLALNNGINTIGNIIDSGYRGECHAILVNHGQQAFNVSVGQKICQLLFIQLMKQPSLIEVNELQVNDFINSGQPNATNQRGVSGFGSTGK